MFGVVCYSFYSICKDPNLTIVKPFFRSDIDEEAWNDI